MSAFDSEAVSVETDDAMRCLSGAVADLQEPSTVIQTVKAGGLTTSRIVRECERLLFSSREPFSESSLKEYRKILFGHGCPSGIRGVLWKAVLGYLPTAGFNLVRFFF